MQINISKSAGIVYNCHEYLKTLQPRSLEMRTQANSSFKSGLFRGLLYSPRKPHSSQLKSKSTLTHHPSPISDHHRPIDCCPLPLPSHLPCPKSFSSSSAQLTATRAIMDALHLPSGLVGSLYSAVGSRNSTHHRSQPRKQCQRIPIIKPKWNEIPATTLSYRVLIGAFIVQETPCDGGMNIE